MRRNHFSWDSVHSSLMLFQCHTAVQSFFLLIIKKCALICFVHLKHFLPPLHQLGGKSPNCTQFSTSQLLALNLFLLHLMCEVDSEGETTLRLWAVFKFAVWDSVFFFCCFFLHPISYAAFEMGSLLIRTIYKQSVCECMASYPSAFKHSSGNVIYGLLSTKWEDIFFAFWTSKWALFQCA